MTTFALSLSFLVTKSLTCVLQVLFLCVYMLFLIPVSWKPINWINRVKWMELDLLCLFVPYTCLCLFIFLYSDLYQSIFIIHFFFKFVKRIKQSSAVPLAVHYLECWIPSSEISRFLDFDLTSGFRVNVQRATHGTQVRYKS